MMITKMKPINCKILFLFFLLLVSTAGAQLPPAQKALLDSSQRFFQERNFDKAQEEIEKLISLNPRIGVAYYVRGTCKFLAGDFKGSIPDFDKAIELSPKAPGIEQVYNNRGTAHQALKDNARALPDFEKAIAINPNYAPPYNGRGVILEKQGKIDEALKDFDKAIALNPKGAAAYVGRGNIRFSRNELDQALSDYNKTIGMEPSAASPYIVRGAIQGLRNRWEISIADLRKGFELDRKSRGPLVGILGVAFSDVDKFIQNNPQNARAFAIRGFINLFRERGDEAEADFKKSFELEPALIKDLDELIESVQNRPIK